MADNYTFDTVKEFIYLAVTIKNYVSLEVKRRINLANRCYYGLNRQLGSRDLSRTIKLIFYKNMCFFMAQRHGRMEELMQQPWEYSKEKSYVRTSVQCKLAMISATDPTVSYTSSSTI